MDLPDEIIYKILIKTSPEDIIKLCKINVGGIFHDICNDEPFWKEKLAHDFPELYISISKFTKSMSIMSIIPESHNQTYKNYYFDIYYWRGLIIKNYPQFLSRADDDFILNGSYQLFYVFLESNVFTVPIYIFTLGRRSITGWNSLISNKLGDIKVLPSENYQQINDRIVDLFNINPQNYSFQYYSGNGFRNVLLGTNMTLSNTVDSKLSRIELRSKAI